MNLKKILLFIAFILVNFNVICLGEGGKAFEINKKLGRGVNLGNALEAPQEGQWGVTLRKEYFELIKQTGFGVYNKDNHKWRQPLLKALIPKTD